MHLRIKWREKQNTLYLSILVLQNLFIIPAFSQSVSSDFLDRHTAAQRTEIYHATNTIASDSHQKQSVWALVSTHKRGPHWETTFHASAWLLAVTDTTAIFVTAHHAVSLGPQEDRKKGLDPILFLAQPNGVSIEFFFSDIRQFSDCDTALIAIPRQRIASAIPLIPVKPFSGTAEDIASIGGHRVFNLGYPLLETFRKQTFIMGPPDHPELLYREGPWMQCGVIRDTIKSFSLQSNDLRIHKCDCIRLNYLSEAGFSGGPVFLEASGELIGMLVGSIESGLQPAIDGDRIKLVDYRGAYVLSVVEILRLLEKN